MPGVNFLDVLVKQTKCSWEEQSCFQLNLPKNLLHNWVEAERKFADESLPLTCTKRNGEFLLFLLICAWILSLQGSHCLARAGQQGESGIIPELFQFNTAHSSVIQQTQGFYHTMSRKYTGSCSEECKHVELKVISGVTITKPM